MSKIAREKMWESRIEQFKQSGQKLTKWCSINKIRVDTFSYWLAKEKNDAAPKGVDTSQWVSLKIIDNTPELPSESRLTIKIGKAVIDINRGFNPEILLDVVKVLNEVC